MTIYNNPHERRRITYPYTYWDNGFTKDELDAIIGHCEAQGLTRAQIIGSIDDDITRRSNVRFINYSITPPDMQWIFHRFNDIATRLNDQFYNFNLNGFDSLQYTTYDAAEAGHYDCHMDMIMGPNSPQDMQEPRKLSMSLALNDGFEGGEFHICNGNPQDMMTVPLPMGRVIAFPSFLIHRVTPVTNGIRKSMVCWVTGPKFV